MASIALLERAHRAVGKKISHNQTLLNEMQIRIGALASETDALIAWAQQSDRIEAYRHLAWRRIQSNAAHSALLSLEASRIQGIISSDNGRRDLMLRQLDTAKRKRDRLRMEIELSELVAIKASQATRKQDFR